MGLLESLASREWARRDIIGARLTMNVSTLINHYENFIVTARVGVIVISAVYLIR